MIKKIAVALAISTTPIVGLADNLEQRLQELEQRLENTEAATQAAHSSSTHASSFNPEINLFLHGRYAKFSNDPENYKIPGFQLVGEAGPGKSGFSLGHSEIEISANIDDKFYGFLAAAIEPHEGSIEVEEGYLETLGLGGGFTIKAGRFLSDVGYLNKQHEDIWDFADAPLIYQGLFGGHLHDDGVQVNWIAPTDLFIQAGAELFRGDIYPAAGAAHDGVGAFSLFANFGSDVGNSHSWQIGLSHWAADVEGRAGDAHHHGDEDVEETPSFTGDSEINAFDFVWKWAPNGNPKIRNFKLQFEYFDRQEDGTITMLGSNPLEMSSYDGHQKGWYAQTVYQFMPKWRIGLRYDHLDSDNKGSDDGVLAEAELDNEGITPKRYSTMIDWSYSDFSRIRLQYNRDEYSDEPDDQIFLQYIMSVGSHGAHEF